MSGDIELLLGDLPDDIEHNAQSYKNVELVTLCNCPHMQDKLRSMTRLRVRRVRSVRGYASLDAETVNELIYSSLALGYYRALIDRYSEDHNLTREWWMEQRKAMGRRTDDRTYDHDIIVDQCPDFNDYYPDIPLSNHEVLEAAKKEFYDQVAGRGTEYHAYRHIGTPIDITDSREYLGSRTDVDVYTKKWVLERYADHPFGPAATRALEIAMDEFGALGVCWVIERLLYQNQVTKMIRESGLFPEITDYKELRTFRKNVQRNLDRIDDLIRHRLANDLEMQNYYELIMDGGPLETASQTPT